MKQKLFSIILLWILCISFSYAQNRQVTGRVTSASTGEGLAGVTVREEGAIRATQTDQNGNYSMHVGTTNVRLIF